MRNIRKLIPELSFRSVHAIVGKQHDRARMDYHLTNYEIEDYNEFIETVVDYYIYHHNKCVSRGGAISKEYALQQIKPIFARNFEDQNGIMLAFNEAKEGTQGGISFLITILANSMKQEAIMSYIDYKLEQEIPPDDKDLITEFLSEFFKAYGDGLDPSIDQTKPEYYISQYKQIVFDYNSAMQIISKTFHKA